LGQEISGAASNRLSNQRIAWRSMQNNEERLAPVKARWALNFTAPWAGGQVDIVSFR
jgi:hypothetical protein